MHFLSPFDCLTLKNKINNTFSSPKILNYLKQTKLQYNRMDMIFISTPLINFSQTLGPVLTLICITELTIFTWILIGQSHSQNPKYDNTVSEIYYSSQSSILNKIHWFYVIKNKKFVIVLKWIGGNNRNKLHHNDHLKHWLYIIWTPWDSK